MTGCSSALSTASSMFPVVVDERDLKPWSFFFSLVRASDMRLRLSVLDSGTNILATNFSAWKTTVQTNPCMKHTLTVKPQLTATSLQRPLINCVTYNLNPNMSIFQERNAALHKRKQVSYNGRVPLSPGWTLWRGLTKTSNNC